MSFEVNPSWNWSRSRRSSGSLGRVSQMCWPCERNSMRPESRSLSVEECKLPDGQLENWTAGELENWRTGEEVADDGAVKPIRLWLKGASWMEALNYAHSIYSSNIRAWYIENEIKLEIIVNYDQKSVKSQEIYWQWGEMNKYVHMLFVYNMCSIMDSSVCCQSASPLVRQQIFAHTVHAAHW